MIMIMVPRLMSLYSFFFSFLDLFSHVLGLLSVTDGGKHKKSCGLYEYAGEWQYSVGLPAKSGVSGVLMVVVPNVGGFCLYQPKLDDLGNSKIGISYFKELVRIFNFHIYDRLVSPVFLSFHSSLSLSLWVEEENDS